jgi:uncharacterized protein YutE (UPF0331/DUF86 family)
MVTRDLFAAKLAELRDRVQRVTTHVPESVETLRADRDALDLVAFNLMLCVQICADIASHVIADEGWPVARSLAEGFTRLEERGVLSSGTAEGLRRAVGLRNVVAHGYAGIDVDMCFRAATGGVADFEAYARELSTWALAHSD